MNLIVFDTSALLNIYSHSEKNISIILKFFSEKNELIWIPKQVEIEFNRNSSRAKKEAKDYNALNRNLTTIIKSETPKKIKNIMDHYKACNFENIEILEKNIIDKLDEIKNIIDDYNSSMKKNSKEIKSIHIEDQIAKALKSLSIGEEFSIPEKIEAYEEGEKRYKYKIPPGYKDDSKDSPEKFGDLIIWKQILKKVKFISEPATLYFVSSDFKEDWIEENSLKIELINELKEINSKISIKLLSLNEFIEKINEGGFL